MNGERNGLLGGTDDEMVVGGQAEWVRKKLHATCDDAYSGAGRERKELENLATKGQRLTGRSVAPAHLNSAPFFIPKPHYYFVPTWRTRLREKTRQVKLHRVTRRPTIGGEILRTALVWGQEISEASKRKKKKKNGERGKG